MNDRLYAQVSSQGKVEKAARLADRIGQQQADRKGDRERQQTQEQAFQSRHPRDLRSRRATAAQHGHIAALSLGNKRNDQDHKGQDQRNQGHAERQQ